MNPDSVASRLAAGLVRVAVAVQSDTVEEGAPPTTERTIAQQQILLMLARRSENYPLTELAALLGMSLRDATVTSGALVREGLVRRRPSPSYAPDEVWIRLTRRGRAAVPESASWADAMLGQVERLEETEQRRVLGMVTRQIATLQKDGRIPVTRICATCRFFAGYAHPGIDSPHHCHDVDAPFGHRELRLRCTEHSLPDPPG